MRLTGRERGAVMVEMALVLPLLLLPIVGSFEFGLLFHERLNIASSAARTGATMGDRDEADYAILQALEAGLYEQVDTSVIIRSRDLPGQPDHRDEAGPVGWLRLHRGLWLQVGSVSGSGGGGPHRQLASVGS